MTRPKGNVPGKRTGANDRMSKEEEREVWEEWKRGQAAEQKEATPRSSLSAKDIAKLEAFKPEAELVSLSKELAKLEKKIEEEKAVDLRALQQRVLEFAIQIYPTYFKFAGVSEEAERAAQDPAMARHPVVKERQGVLGKVEAFLKEKYPTDQESILYHLKTTDEAIGKGLRETQAKALQWKKVEPLNAYLNKLAEESLVYRPSYFTSQQLEREKGFILKERCYMPFSKQKKSLIAFPVIRTVVREVIELVESPEVIAQRQAESEAKQKAWKEFEGKATVGILEAVEGQKGVLLLKVEEDRLDQAGQKIGRKTGHVLLETLMEEGKRGNYPGYRPSEGFEPWLKWVSQYALDKDGKPRKAFPFLPQKNFHIDGIPEGTALYRLVNNLIAPALAEWYGRELEREQAQKEAARIRQEREAQKDAALARRKELLANPGISPVALLAGEPGICNYPIRRIATKSRGPDDLTISVEGNGQGLLKLVDYISTMKFSPKPEMAIDLSGAVGKEIPLASPEEREDPAIRVLRYVLNYAAEDYQLKELIAQGEITATQLVDGEVGVCAFVNPKAQIGSSRGPLALSYERVEEGGPVYFRRYVSPGKVFHFETKDKEIPLVPPKLPEGEKEDGAVFHLRKFLLERRDYEKWKATQQTQEPPEESATTSSEEKD